MTKRLLNLGCGGRFHPDWENLDFSPIAPSVRAHDLRKGIPFPDESFDVVYHSHVLEHFPKGDAPVFLRECHRVLKQGGVIRVAVPDLERIARMYLRALEKASQGAIGWNENYDWMLLELYDQAVRETSGGSCYEYLRQDPIRNWEFIHERFGAEAVAAREAARKKGVAQQNKTELFRVKWSYISHNVWKVCRNKLIGAILRREELEALQVGWFRRGGEVHLWMYDGYSLAKLLLREGFFDPSVRTATESQIPHWAQYCLDNEPDGRAYKPDSLYMEAVKS
jgi:predicted SAM-dependent methyltransferase